MRHTTPNGAAPADPPAHAVFSRRNLWSGILFGIGLVGFIDETVFHQLLHWHHFYDLATLEIGLVSDGFFHAFSWLATIGGLFLLADLRHRRAFRQSRWWAGVLLGAGALQLYDGTVHHMWMQIHQIRNVPDTLPYDLAWNITAAVLIAAGVVLTVKTRHSPIPR